MYKHYSFPLLICCLLIACGGGGGDPPDTTPPTVFSTSQANGASAVAVNSAISAAFSEAVASASITAANFTVSSPTGPVAGTISVNGSTATFTPSAALAPATLYTVRLSGATDAAGNALATSLTWTFTTAAAPDSTPPTVSSTSPANTATGVGVNSAISVTFSEAMLPSTITSATFTVSGGVAGTVSYSGTTATFTPSINLAFSTTYTATITTSAKDAAGNALTAPYTWTFTTGAAPDTTPPTVSSTSPANAATGVGVNSAISVTFSEAMLPSAVTGATFTVSGGVTGTVAYSGTTATFTPSTNLASSTTYMATITTGVKDTAGNALTAPYAWTFTTSAAPDTTPPTVSSTSPANAATGIGVNSAIGATFTEAMLPSTITNATFAMSGGVTGTVTYNGATATFTPFNALAPFTTFAATITTGVKDAAGNALVTPYLWTFTTGAAPDTTPPTVSSTNPANGATGVATNSSISATFSEVMLQSTMTSATFAMSGGVTGTVSYAGTTATFTPSNNLAASTTFAATITTGAKDAAGNALATPYLWTFTTAAPDTTPPIVTSTSPASAATGVAANSAISATFSEGMLPSTITNATFTISGGVTGTVSYSGNTATFTPSSSLAFSTTYTATITTGVRDAAGNALAVPYLWTFTTGAAPDATPPTVTSTTPIHAATGVPVNSAISATFSEGMLPSTLTSATFTVSGGVTGTVSYSGNTVTFTPLNSLAPFTTFTATITAGAKDLAGNPLTTPFTWTFTSGAAPAGSLDTSFNATGKAFACIPSCGPLNSFANAVAMQADRKVVAAGHTLEAGSSTRLMAVVRFNTDGSLDTTFGTGGKVTTDIGTFDDEAFAVAVQANGKIVVAGRASYLIPGGQGSVTADFVIVRYNTDGTLDTSFGTGGKVITDFSSGYDGATTLAIQSDGKLVAAGYANDISGSDFAIARYNANGTLDTSFGTGGKVTTAFGVLSESINAIAIQTDGKILATGYGNGDNLTGNNDFLLARYNADGSLDTSFGTGGKVRTAIGAIDEAAFAVAIQSDGKIVAAGLVYYTDTSQFYRSDFALVRYNTNGTLDTSFGTGGNVTTGIGRVTGAQQSGDDYAYGVAIQSDGKIVVVGYTFDPDSRFALARYNPNGTLDSSFGTGGKVITPVTDGVPPISSAASAVTIQTDGRIVVVGFGNGGHLVVVRYWP